MIRVARPAMNTLFGIALPDDASHRARLAADEALLEADRLERSLSRFIERSDIGRINAAAGRAMVAIEPETLALLTEVVALVEAVDGAFDPTVGPLMNLWRGRSYPPDESEIADALSIVGIQGLVLDADSCQAGLLCEGMALDLGGVGKGYAVGRIADELRSLGVAEALVDGGTSSVLALGSHQAGIAEPGTPGEPFATVPLRDQAAAVSGVRGAGFAFEGRFYGHIVDPRTGWPSQGPRVAAVICPSPVTAEVLSTALLVAGQALLDRLPERFPDACAMLVCDGCAEPILSSGWPNATNSS
ncbi:MAG: FAD:protein FMN transferase [Armatimonadetes bacterium]|nr:FAD:protein FMN transferase [Armatimonadota bacterium]